MPQHKPIRMPLAGTVGDTFFQRQEDDYSCGPASMTTVANIYGVEATYDAIRIALDPDPMIGTTVEKMAALSEFLMPMTGAGERTYTGGVAIANMVQGGEGHYVVFLCKQGDDVIYYDPYEHELVIDDINNIEWHSGDGVLRNWTVNFAPLEDNSFARWMDMAKPKAPDVSNAPTTPKPPAPPPIP